MSMMLGIVDTILGAIGTILYPLFSTIFILIDLLQELFYAFAGIGSLTYDGTTITGDMSNFGDETTGGIVYYLLTSDFVHDLFWSMAYLAFILLIIFMGVAFFRNIYASKPKNWKDIVGNAIKGICNFVFVPVVLLLGIWVGNILLVAINDATSQYGDATMSRQLFIASAYNANDIREDESISAEERENVISLCEKYNIDYDSSVGVDDWEYWAEKVDEVFTSGLDDSGSRTDIHWWGSVANWYTLIDINYIVLLGGGLFILYALGAMTFGVVKRLIYIIILYIIGPITCSMYPLDDGKMVSSWRNELTKYVVMAYGSVVGLNLALDILPIVQNIDFSFGAAVTNWMLHGIIPVLLTICVLLCAKDFINLFSTWVGGANAYSDGAGLMSSTKAKVAQGGKHIGSAAKKTTSWAFSLREYGRARHDLSVANKDQEKKRDAFERASEESEAANKEAKNAESNFSRHKKKLQSAQEELDSTQIEYNTAHASGDAVWEAQAKADLNTVQQKYDREKRLYDNAEERSNKAQENKDKATEVKKAAQNDLLAASQKTAAARGRRRENGEQILRNPIKDGLNSAMSYLTAGTVNLAGIRDATRGESERRKGDIADKQSAQGIATYGVREAIEAFGGKVDKNGNVSEIDNATLKTILDSLPDDMVQKGKEKIAKQNGISSKTAAQNDENTKAVISSYKAFNSANDKKQELWNSMNVQEQQWALHGYGSKSDFTPEQIAAFGDGIGKYLEKYNRLKRADSALESAIEELGNKMETASKKGSNDPTLIKEMQDMFKHTKLDTSLDNVDEFVNGVDGKMKDLINAQNKNNKQLAEAIIANQEKQIKQNEGKS